MARFEYYDLICPHCNKSTRARFEVVQSYSDTTLKGNEFERCQNHECREIFIPFVKTVYKGRKLRAYEERRLQKKLEAGEII